MTRHDPLPRRINTVLIANQGARTGSDLLKLGVTDNDLEYWVRSGQLVRLSRSRYALPPSGEGSNDSWAAQRARHLRLLAGVQASTPDAVAAARTAAIVHGLPVHQIPDAPEVIRHPDRAQVLGARVIRTALSERDRLNTNGFEVTTLERTSVDVAIDLPSALALVAIDPALRRGASPDLMAQVLMERGSVRGCRQARRTLNWADGHSESPLESASRGLLLARRVPRPRCNVTLWFDGRQFRVDNLWDQLGIVGEADGRIKYEGGLAVGDTLWQEKVRQEWLENSLDLIVVRWTAAEIYRHADDVAARWRRAKQRRQANPWIRPPGLVMDQNPLPDPRGVRIREILG